MKKLFNHRYGFSLIEMLVATVLVLFLSATSYRILTSQGNKQRESVFGQKQNMQALRALDAFKKDASLIDYNWSKFGVAAVYPCQGCGFGDNFYVNPFAQTEGLNDGVTFLKRDVKKSSLYTLNVNAEHPTVSGTSVPLYGQWLTLQESTADISRNDWVILFSAGKYVLGVVTAKSHSSPVQIKIREPDANTEVQITHFNSFVNRSSGYVIRAGVVPGSYDSTTTNTASLVDDSIKFEQGKTYVQVVQPVSYELDWATTDQQPSGTGNQHILDENGNPKKVIVRTEYKGGGVKREYLAEANQMGITYDALVAKQGGTDSLNGFTNGDIVKDVGRETNSSVQFVNLSINPNDPAMSSDAFISTSKIISLRMFLGGDSKKGQDQNQKFNEIRVALDPSRKNNQYQESGSVLAQNSGDLSQVYDLSGKRIGQPLYLRHADLAERSGDNQVYVPGSGQVDVVVPVGTIDPTTGTPENGKLVVLDEAGVPATEGCAVANCEQITFVPPSANSYFYPSTMVEKPEDTSGMKKIFIGGFAVSVNNSTDPVTVTRKPMMAEIEYPSNMSFREYVAASGHNDPANPHGTNCSLAGCTLKEIGSSSITGSTARLKDTSGIAVDGNDVYVSSITRSSGNDSTLSIYKTDLNLTNFTEKVVDNAQGISTNRVTGAIADKPIVIGNQKYLAITTSRSINSGVTAGEDGKILLYNLTTPNSAPIEIANQNFKVNSLTVMKDNLVLTGKLVSQVFKAEDIAALVNGTQTVVPTFYTDEMANYIPADPVTQTPAVKQYADGYFTLSSAYNNQSANTYQQVLGWNTGLSAAKISDMEYGVVLGNQSLMETNGGHGLSQYEQQDFTTLSVNFGGMTERVIAAIDTNFNNLEASEVVVKYSQKQSVIPNVLLPGVMYSAPSPRLDPAPLPALLPGNMSESQWVAFYQDYMDIYDHSSNPVPVTFLPDPNVAIFQCGNSVPPTCGSGHGSGNDGMGGGGDPVDGGPPANNPPPAQ